MYLESLKYCLLGDELADLVLPHWPDQNDAIFSCSFVQPVLDLADKSLNQTSATVSLSVINQKGHIAFESSINLVMGPSILGISPAALVNHTVSAKRPRMVEILTEDPGFFETYNTTAVILGEPYQIYTSNQRVFFDYAVGRLYDPSSAWYNAYE